MWSEARVTNCPRPEGYWDMGLPSAKTRKVLGKSGWAGHLRGHLDSSQDSNPPTCLADLWTEVLVSHRDPRCQQELNKGSDNNGTYEMPGWQPGLLGIFKRSSETCLCRLQIFNLVFAWNNRKCTSKLQKRIKYAYCSIFNVFFPRTMSPPTPNANFSTRSGSSSPSLSGCLWGMFG